MSDLFSDIGNVLDTPGSILRAGLAGRNPLTGIFAPALQRERRLIPTISPLSAAMFGHNALARSHSRPELEYAQ